MITQISHCWLMHDLDLVSLLFKAMINPYFVLNLQFFNCIIFAEPGYYILEYQLVCIVPYPDVNFFISGTAPVINGLATVVANGLECGTSYSIIVGGILNGKSVGPSRSNGKFSTCACPSNSLGEFYISKYLAI